MTEIKIYSDIYKEEIAKLILTIQQKEFQIPITLQEQPDLNDINNFYQRDNGNFWIAIVDDTVVGTIGLLDIGDDKGALRKMFVRVDFRGKRLGIGQKLLDTMLQWSKQRNLKVILLGTTEKFLAAQRFYEKNGFTEIQKDALPPKFPVMTVDVKFYKYDLTYAAPGL